MSALSFDVVPVVIVLMVIQEIKGEDRGEISINPPCWVWNMLCLSVGSSECSVYRESLCSRNSPADYFSTYEI